MSHIKTPIAVEEPKGKLGVLLVGLGAVSTTFIAGVEISVSWESDTLHIVGLNIDPARSILVPTAHNEPAIQLSIYREMFAKPAAVAYNTEVEKNFLKTTFEFRSVAEETVGCGVDLMADQQQPDDPEPEDDEELHKRLAPHLRARGAQFRRRHRLQGQFLLYGGRIDAGKGCEELIEYFGSYVKEGGDATLALMGAKLMVLPEEPFIRFAGLLSDSERMQALEAANVVVCPSPYESLSLLALEAMAAGTPVLANARSAVLLEHCVNSNGGLYYADRDEFVECLNLLVEDQRLCAALGQNGRQYILRNYRWDVVLAKYERIFAKLRNAR